MSMNLSLFIGDKLFPSLNFTLKEMLELLCPLFVLGPG